MSYKPLWRILAERSISNWCRLAPEGVTAFYFRTLGFKLSSHLPKRALVNEGETVIQTGCWRTETLVEWSECVGEGGHVIAVEPDPTNIDVLQIEAERRELDNISIVEKAVWNEKTTLNLQSSEQSRRNKIRDTGTFSPRQTESNYSQDVEVQADTIDNIVSEVGVGYPDHVHLTVSGAEREAINGMEETLQQPGVRAFVRAILNDEKTGEIMNEVVAGILSNQGLNVAMATREKNRGGGGNVYAANL